MPSPTNHKKGNTQSLGCPPEGDWVCDGHGLTSEILGPMTVAKYDQGTRERALRLYYEAVAEDGCHEARCTPKDRRDAGYHPSHTAQLDPQS